MVSLWALYCDFKGTIGRFAGRKKNVYIWSCISITSRTWSNWNKELRKKVNIQSFLWKIHQNKTIEFMVMAWLRLILAQAKIILAWAVRRGLTWALRRAQNIFMLKNINYDYHFGGHWENQSWKRKTRKRSEEYFFHELFKKTSANTKMASWFWVAAYTIWLFDS